MDIAALLMGLSQMMEQSINPYVGVNLDIKL